MNKTDARTPLCEISREACSSEQPHFFLSLMILYPRSCSAMGLLLTCAGSALPRALVPAIFSTVWTIIIQVIYDSQPKGHAQLEYLFDNPYPYQVFTYMVGVALVFRTNVAYNRYWEGVQQFKTFTAKWADAAPSSSSDSSRIGAAISASSSSASPAGSSSMKELVGGIALRAAASA